MRNLFTSLILSTTLFPSLLFANPIADAAKARIGKTKFYDPAYVALDYPGGDVATDRGVCTDVVIRALRAVSIDLQKRVHEDMRANFSRYPKNWGLTRPDRNIDHRRVPNLMTYFKRKRYTVTDKAFKPGDILVWKLSNGRLHTGIVAAHKTKKGHPFIIHNIGAGTLMEDLLHRFKIIGHYRIPLKP